MDVPRASPTARRPPVWRIVLFLALTLAVVAVVVRSLGGLGPILERARGADFRLLPVVFVLSAAALALGAFRWRLILLVMGHRVPYRRVLEAVIGTWPLGAVSPSRASDLVRAWVLRRRVPPLRGAGSVVAEKMIDVQSLCLMGLIGSVLSGLGLWAAVTGGLLASFWAGLALLFLLRRRLAGIERLRRFEERIESAFAALEALRCHPRALLAVSAASILGWLMAASMVWLLLVVYGAPLPAALVMALWPLAAFVGQVPVTVGGIGTRDAAFALLVRQAGAQPASEPALLAATLSYALIGFWLWVIVGLPVMARLGLATPPDDPLSDEPPSDAPDDRA